MNNIQNRTDANTTKKKGSIPSCSKAKKKSIHQKCADRTESAPAKTSGRNKGKGKKGSKNEDPHEKNAKGKKGEKKGKCAKIGNSEWNSDNWAGKSSSSWEGGDWNSDWRNWEVTRLTFQIKFMWRGGGGPFFRDGPRISETGVRKTVSYKCFPSTCDARSLL